MQSERKSKLYQNPSTEILLFDISQIYRNYELSFISTSEETLSLNIT